MSSRSRIRSVRRSTSFAVHKVISSSVTNSARCPRVLEESRRQPRQSSTPVPSGLPGRCGTQTWRDATSRRSTTPVSAVAFTSQLRSLAREGMLVACQRLAQGPWTLVLWPPPGADDRTTSSQALEANKVILSLTRSRNPCLRAFWTSTHGVHIGPAGASRPVYILVAVGFSYSRL